MSIVDLLSDTTYSQQAVRQLHRLLGNVHEFPVESSQIYGLRQIARQQPDKVLGFAQHQRERAERLQKKQVEIDFWALVANLCNDSPSIWSVRNEADNYLPADIRDIPDRRPDMTQEERQHRNKLRERKREWLKQWENDHIPAFFERFCTQCLYRKAMIEMSQPSG